MASSTRPTIPTAQLARANNGFALDMYQQISGERKGRNLFFSPLSISTALAMTYAGAGGDTATQMSNVLRFRDVNSDQLHEAFKQLHSCMHDPIARCKLRSANKLYGKAGYPFSKEFLNTAAAFYKSTIEAVADFGLPEVAHTINYWVSEQTEGKIANLISPGVLNSLTRMVLVNAIYFKGPWASPFKSYQTNQSVFRVLDERKTVPVQLMHQSDDFKLAEDNALDCMVLELPYEGNDFSMLIALPNKDDGLAHLEANLSADTLKRWNDNLKERLVNIWLPKVRVEDEFNLNRVLSDMGMTDAFDHNKANFEGISGNRDLYISDVVHKAFVEINEEGSEAAAATAVMMTFGSCMFLDAPKPVNFRVDHPFLFMIWHRPTQSTLFIGRVMDTSVN
ncbi:leukocyte elastase inhibitor A-like isoform X1 [Diadema antillarum]|uniref:leukocyte elastase inhibitor A-like isoform X1 n=1 Tax=Diadema antillarum TaxID=105358 RepID=UPI003A89A2FA